MSQLDRRTFLKLGGAGLAGITLAPVLGACGESIVDPPRTRAGFVPFITPTSEFYVQHGGRDTIAGWTMPDLTRETWSLEFRGNSIVTPMTITWQHMQAAIDAGHERRILKTMRCVLDSHLRPGASGWTGTAVWAGVPLRHFIDQVGVHDEAYQLAFTGADRFSNNITLERLGTTDQGAMEPLLVYEMNGAPLTREHGAPVRLLLLEGYGYKSVKWLTAVNVTGARAPIGTYQREGFVDDGIIRVANRSLNIADDAVVDAGLIEITGYALSGYAAVAKVEISIDDGAFQAAEIESIDSLTEGATLLDGVLQLQDRSAYPYRAVWTQWRYRWQAPRGTHTVAIRATDKAGNAQTYDDVELKDGLTGIVSYTVTVR